MKRKIYKTRFKELEQTIYIFGAPIKIIAGATGDHVLFLKEGRYIGRIELDVKEAIDQPNEVMKC
jgi:hypothetical protein